ncbi:MAG: hypothetical protein UX86_C0032G0005 [Candidatus Amesbacteria bacterium GW2011_GWC1_47_15]|uniref:Uncharacterized protein n=1 Tax=Candidatus Amesbacteria bacterium GW2011_GWC1_47_15 TaxID=1618364 RepID=A0A0G1S1E9_9BACT|nr:MAG: hypothetical protein UX86_C0032G0005 [Candidatus Amesbacteria bacterium GW2011_GWC1_47_15]
MKQKIRFLLSSVFYLFVFFLVHSFSASSASACTLSTPPMQVGVAGNITLTGGQPFKTYTVIIQPADCTPSTFTITTNASGFGPKAITCNTAGPHTVQAALGAELCESLMAVVTLPTPATTIAPNEAFCTPGNPSSGVRTALGCLPATNAKSLVTLVFRWGIGLAGAVAFVMLVFGGITITTAGGDPKRVKAGQELITTVIQAVLLIALGVVLLNFIGVSILDLVGLGFLV